MKPKKYPKADLNLFSGLFFVIGLVVTLFFTWIALEHKSYDIGAYIQIVKEEQIPDMREDVPITEIFRAEPPPPPPAAPSVIEVIEDKEEIEETVIKSTEISQETIVDEPIIAVEDVEVGEEEEGEITVPFAVIEDIPVFPGCEDGSDQEKRACFQKEVQKHVKENFRYPEVALEMGIQGKVYVQFVIDSKGHITRIRTRGPDRLLEEEALRIIALLPQMTPGKQRGRSVNVPYSIPINFKLL